VKIMEKMTKKAKDNMQESAVTIAFLGDSVTQGCFEIYPNGETIGDVFDNEHAYYNCMCKILAYLYPGVPVNVIKAGISGDRAPHGLERLEKDVLRFQPDLTIVCFGLNDSFQKAAGIDIYRQALIGIFTKIKESGSELIFMTPNMLNTYISPCLAKGLSREIGAAMGEIQLSGTMDLYMDTARQVCLQYGVRICDCYAKWKLLEKNGVDTTALLANHINHPTREMSWLFAYSLVECMMQE